MKFKEELEALKESGEIVEIADGTRGTFGGIIKEVGEKFITYIGIQKRTDDGYDYLIVASERLSGLIRDTKAIILKPIKNFTIKSSIANISIREMSEKEKRKIRMYLLLIDKAEKKEKKKRKRKNKNEF